LIKDHMFRLVTALIPIELQRAKYTQAFVSVAVKNIFC